MQMLRGGSEADPPARQGLLRRASLVSGCGGQRDAQPAANMSLTKHLRVAIIDSNQALESRSYLGKNSIPDSRVSTVTPATISFFKGVISSSRLVLPIFNGATYIYEAHVQHYFKICSYVSPSYSEHHRRVLKMMSLDACRSVEHFIDTHGPDALDRIIRA
ncbi:hypothetical protein ZEAMMB73_Zm00001d049041, partial [Zea mays]